MYVCDAFFMGYTWNYMYAGYLAPNDSLCDYHNYFYFCKIDVQGGKTYNFTFFSRYYCRVYADNHNTVSGLCHYSSRLCFYTELVISRH